MLIDPRQERILIEQSERIMATTVGVHVAAAPGEEARASAAIEDCLAWLREVDSRLSRFAAESELCQLNAATGAWHAVSEPLFAVVEESIAAAEGSGGLFDPALLPVPEELGYDRDFKEIAYREAAPASEASHLATGGGGWRTIELDRNRRRIRLPPGVRLDLGGIAKGWAADVVLDRCFSSLPNVLIDVGGDLRAQGGLREGEPWAIAIDHPHGTPQPPDPATARHAAIVTRDAAGWPRPARQCAGGTCKLR